MSLPPSEQLEQLDERKPQSTSPATVPPDLHDVVHIARFENLPSAASRRCANCACLASIFCRADAAFLCASCDSLVHSANRLAARHHRVPLPVPPSFLSTCEQHSDDLLLQAGAHIAREAAHLALSSGMLLSTPSCTTDASSSAHAESTDRKRKRRQEALVRFRSKRSRRSFAKTVRYECRKTLAQNRPRIKGRFVNKSEMEIVAKFNHQQSYQRFLHQIADNNASAQSSEGSAILSDAANSPESHGEMRYGF